MRKFTVRVIVGVLVALSSLGCNKSSTPTSPTPVAAPSTVSFSGQVLDQNSNPVVLARIEIIQGPDVGRFVVTAANGEFRFARLTRGTITLRVSASDYVSLTQQVVVPGEGVTRFVMQFADARITLEIVPNSLISQPSSDQTFPSQVRFSLRVHEHNGVNLELRVVTFSFVAGDGRLFQWPPSADDEVLEYFGTTAVAGGSHTDFPVWLLYSGRRDGVLTVAVEVSDNRGQRHSAVARAFVN